MSSSTTSNGPEERASHACRSVSTCFRLKAVFRSASSIRRASSSESSTSRTFKLSAVMGRGLGAAEVFLEELQQVLEPELVAGVRRNQRLVGLQDARGALLRGPRPLGGQRRVQ